MIEPRRREGREGVFCFFPDWGGNNQEKENAFGVELFQGQIIPSGHPFIPTRRDSSIHPFPGKSLVLNREGAKVAKVFLFFPDRGGILSGKENALGWSCSRDKSSQVAIHSSIHPSVHPFIHPSIHPNHPIIPIIQAEGFHPFRRNSSPTNNE